MSICYDWGEGSGLLLYEKPCNKDIKGINHIQLQFKIYISFIKLRGGSKKKMSGIFHSMTFDPKHWMENEHRRSWMENSTNFFFSPLKPNPQFNILFVVNLDTDQRDSEMFNIGSYETLLITIIILVIIIFNLIISTVVICCR